METNSVNIFATGPSFGKLDLKQFESPFHVNFCIKQTAFDVPWEPDFIYWQDPEWWWEYKERLLSFVKTSVLMACDGLPSEDRPVEYYERSMLMGLDMEPGFIAHGANSGYGAINVCAQMGFKQIHLYGYDYYDTEDGFQNYHKIPKKENRRMTHHHLVNWYIHQAPKLLGLGIKVLNHNPNSNLKTYPLVVA